MPTSRTLRLLRLSSGVIRMRHWTGLKEASPWKRSKVKRSVWSKKTCSPFPKNSELPGCAALTPLGEGTRRPSINDSEEAVMLKKVCWPRTLGQIGRSPFQRLRLKGSYQRELV